MSRSIMTKILLLIAGIMFATALILIFITRKDVGHTVLGMEEKSIRNAMYLIKLNVENEYRSLLFHKLSMLSERKNQMKMLTSMVVAGIGEYRDMAENHLISEAVAEKRALDWTAGLRYGSDAHFLVFNEKGIVLAHPNTKLIGKDLSSVEDIRGLSLFGSMLKRSKREGEGFASFSWDDMNTGKALKQLGYFTFYPRWKWMVGTAVPIEDIEREADKKLNLILKELRKTFAKTKVAKTGFIFLFNGDKKILISPEGVPQDTLTSAKDVTTDELLLDTFMAAAKHPQEPIQYVWTDPRQGQPGASRYESYADYFKTLNWYIVSVARTSEIQMPAKHVVFRQTTYIALVFVIGVIMAYFLLKRISQHLNKLTDHAKQLPEYDFSAPEADLPKIEQLAVKYRDEVGKLAEAFLFMEGSLEQYIVDLRETTAAKERIESELVIARDIQMSILPKLFPPFPDKPEFDIYATVKPAREVGGDFYDFFFVDENQLFFVLGDVSGKGVPASLFMAITTAFLRATATKEMSPAAVLAQVNNKLCMGNDACMFVTVFCGLLNTKTGEVICADGGHNPPLLISSRNGVEFLQARKSPALGVFEELPYHTHQVTLEPGDSIFMYTDGVTEATNVNEELYSEERLHESIVELRDRPIEDISRQMIERIEGFAQGAPQSDDITMMILKYKGAAAK